MANPTSNMTNAIAEPVKIVLERRVKPGAEERFSAWLTRLMGSAAREPALQGSSVLTTAGGEYFILLRFATRADLESWEGSPDVIRLLEEGNAYSSAEHEPALRTGMETWFTLPGLPMPATAPPKWKMALVTWLALLPQAILLSFVLPKTWPSLLATAVGTALPVAMLTWVMMPVLTKWLYPWLYAPAKDDQGAYRPHAKEA